MEYKLGDDIKKWIGNNDRKLEYGKRERVFKLLVHSMLFGAFCANDVKFVPMLSFIILSFFFLNCLSLYSFLVASFYPFRHSFINVGFLQFISSQSSWLGNLRTWWYLVIDCYPHAPSSYKHSRAGQFTYDEQLQKLNNNELPGQKYLETRLLYHSLSFYFQFCL